MKRDTEHWVGIDVSKSKLDVALLDGRGKFKNRVFPNDAKGHVALVTWLLERVDGAAGSLHACQEATGPYGEAIATVLCDMNILVSVVNPARVKGFAQSEQLRNKTDRADSELLARFCLKLAPEAWVAPALEVRELRSLVDRLNSLKEMQQQETNRLEGAVHQPSMLASIQSHLVWLKASIEELQRRIDDHIDRHPGLRNDAELITSIPGLGRTSAAKLLAYIGDPRRFKSGKALSAFIGVVPRLHQSGSSVRGRTMISRSGHAELRHALYMPALVALRHNPLVSEFGVRLKETGLAPKAVVAACMHKLVLLVYGILKSGSPFNPQYGANRLDLQDGI